MHAQQPPAVVVVEPVDHTALLAQGSSEESDLTHSTRWHCPRSVWWPGVALAVLGLAGAAAGAWTFAASRGHVRAPPWSRARADERALGLHKQGLLLPLRAAQRAAGAGGDGDLTASDASDSGDERTSGGKAPRAKLDTSDSGSGDERASARKAGIVYVHMANTKEAVTWAVGRGANGVELDLRFDSDTSLPVEFRHSSHDDGDFCDCALGDLNNDAWFSIGGVASAVLPQSVVIGIRTWSWVNPYTGFGSEDNVCKHLPAGSPCHAATPAPAMLIHLANFSDQLAVVYIDGKVDRSDAPKDLAAAGRNAVKLIDEHLFGKGFEGQVVLSVPSVAHAEYLRGAVAAAGESEHGGRYYYSIDGQSTPKSLSEVLNSVIVDPWTDSWRTLHGFNDTVRALLDLQTPNRVYLVGISPVFHVSFHESVALAAYNRRIGVLSSAGVWTLDREHSMNAYLDYGADAIMTNFPQIALEAFAARGIPLAAVGAAFTPAVSGAVADVLPVGEACANTSSCENHACGYTTAANGALQICCPSGNTTYFATREYCSGMDAGSVCWSDAMCASGHCRGTLGGLKRGTCFDKLDAHAKCQADVDCINGACARETAADGAEDICCPSGAYGIYAGYSYCYGMPMGSVCWSDAMCSGGKCEGNLYGARRGTCRP